MHSYIHTYIHKYTLLKTIKNDLKNTKFYSKAEALFLEICKYLLIIHYFQKLLRFVEWLQTQVNSKRPLLDLKKTRKH